MNAKECKNAHLRLGEEGEDAAARYLAQNGYHILARNWHYGKLELDLVCHKDACIVFVEVKTRHRSDFGGPLAGITPKKKWNLLRAAQAWLTINNRWDLPSRFDIICLTGARGGFSMEHYRNAFECDQFMDCGYSNRQSR